MNSSSTDYSPVTAYLSVSDGAKAIEFYKEAFGATERLCLTDSTSGKVGHAELLLNGGMIMLSSEHPSWSKSPQTLGGTPVKLCLMVKDADASFARATAAGATGTMPPTDMFYGFRSASLRDPFGHEWLVQHEIEKVAPEEMQRRWDKMTKECASPS